MDVAHHDLGLGGVSEQWNAAGLLDLVDDPVPVAHGFEGDRGALGELGEEGADGAGDVVHPSALDRVPIPAEDGEEREVLVCITTDRII